MISRRRFLKFSSAAVLATILPWKKSNLEEQLDQVKYPCADEIVFPTATSGWGTVTHWALCDGDTMEVVYLEEFSLPRCVLSGDTARADLT